MVTRIARLSILDSYGVRWTHETFARDLLQNFFDSAADFRAISLDVRAEAGVVEIRGPETFDLDLLAYIGATTKTSGRTVGGFGEGFKICALIGARDFGLTITAGSGAQEIAVFFDPIPLGRELCYRVTEREADPIAGSYVRLAGCDAACIAAFQAAPAMFRHPDNTKLQVPIAVDEAQGVGVYASLEGSDGEIYYRRQLRGRARFYSARDENPVTLAHDGIIDALEGDRDRRDLPALPVAHAVGMRLTPEALHTVLLYLMPYWKYGNEVLAGLLGAAVARHLTFEWPPRWLARSNERGLVEFAERQGFSIALATFAQVGMPTPEDHYTQLQTRAATPLELARIQVVAGLYGELVGQPARTTAFEVFSTGGAAVAGQHLGNKVIVGAELVAAGFDAVAGTILHELAHETGGEEDIRFLRRLTVLLGAALRSPETVRAARRRYAAARPAPEAPPGAPAPDTSWYTPEHNHGDDNHEGVIVTVIAPPAFPPMEALLVTIRAAAKEIGVPVSIRPETVTGPIGAVTWSAPGVPTLIIGGADVEPPPANRAEPGYRLRTYGPDGLALCPNPAAIQAALRRAQQLRLTGRTGVLVHDTRRQGRRERVRALLGLAVPEPAPRREPSTRRQRDDRVRAYFNGSIGWPGYSMDSAFLHGQHSAVEAWLGAARKSRKAANPLYYEIQARLRVAVAHAETLRDADPDFDDADTFERTAMGAAMGAAVSGYALETGEAAAQARAEAGFRAVRAATARVLDLNVVQAAKEAVLSHALSTAGLGWSVPRRSFDPAVFARELDRGEAEARRLQRHVDEEGGVLIGSMLTTPLMMAARDPKLVRRAARNERLMARNARRSQAIRAAYHGALAASGSALTAAARCLEEAARLHPEPLR